MKSCRHRATALNRQLKPLPLTWWSGWAVAAMLLSSPLQAATLGATAAVDSEAMLRGISQSGGRPSLRLAFELEATRGLYAGAELASVLSRLDDPARTTNPSSAGCLQPGDTGYTGYTGSACIAAKAHAPPISRALQRERDRRLSLYGGVPLFSQGAALLQATLAQHYYAVGQTLQRDYRELRLESSLQVGDDSYALASFISDDYVGSSTLSGGLQASASRPLFTTWQVQLLAGAIVNNRRSAPNYGYGRVGLIWSQRQLTVGLHGHATQSGAKALYGNNLVRPRVTLSVDYRLF